MPSYPTKHKLPLNIPCPGNPPTEVKHANLHSFLPGFHWPDNVPHLATLWHSGRDSSTFTSVVQNKMLSRRPEPFWWIHKHLICVSRLYEFIRIPRLFGESVSPHSHSQCYMQCTPLEHLWHCQLGKSAQIKLVQLAFGCTIISYLLTYFYLPRQSIRAQHRCVHSIKAPRQSNHFTSSTEVIKHVTIIQ